jgi:hypothetical protein
VVQSFRNGVEVHAAEQHAEADQGRDGAPFDGAPGCASRPIARCGGKVLGAHQDGERGRQGQRQHDCTDRARIAVLQSVLPVPRRGYAEEQRGCTEASG